MASVSFIGRIVPPAIAVTVNVRPIASWDVPEIGQRVTFTCIIANSEVEVRCDADQIPDSAMINLYMRALDLARAQVDLLCFRDGYGLTVLLETFISQSGTRSALVMSDPRLAKLCTSIATDQDFDRLCVHVMGNVNLMQALRDLIASITLPHVSCVDCARAMDRIKHLIAPGEQSDGAAWTAMRNALNVSREYLTFITDHSKDARHGRGNFVPGDITTQVTRRSWVIMNRYLELLKIGGTSLPHSEFPLLEDGS